MVRTRDEDFARDKDGEDVTVSVRDLPHLSHDGLGTPNVWFKGLELTHGCM